MNFRRKFLEFPILLRAERPEDVTNVNTHGKRREIESGTRRPLYPHKLDFLCTVIVEKRIPTRRIYVGYVKYVMVR